jgi:hypothetical protein
LYVALEYLLTDDWKVEGHKVLSGIFVDILEDRLFYRGYSLNEMHAVF